MSCENSEYRQKIRAGSRYTFYNHIAEQQDNIMNGVDFRISKLTDDYRYYHIAPPHGGDPDVGMYMKIHEDRLNGKVMTQALAHRLWNKEITGGLAY